MDPIPTQIRYEELLSHTFPGFFLALTVFMMIDVLSPINLTEKATKDISGLGSFIGFILLFGTILGIIIDGIHHTIIERIIFEKFSGLREIDASTDALFPKVGVKLTEQFFFKVLSEKAGIEVFEKQINTRYRYSEFYANTSLSLVPFSLIAPKYLVEVVQIPQILYLYFGGYRFNLIELVPWIILIIAFCCMHRSYRALKAYEKEKFSFISGYLDWTYYINLTINKTFYKNFEIEAKIFSKETQKRELKGGIKVNFRTTLGKLNPINNGKTDVYGIARATLCTEKRGTAIVTATSNKSMPAVTVAHLK